MTLSPAQTGANAERDAAKAELTPIEISVYRLIARGMLNKQIAHELGVSLSAVAYHALCVSRKIGATNRTQLALEWHGIEWREPSAARKVTAP